MKKSKIFIAVILVLCLVLALTLVACDSSGVTNVDNNGNDNSAKEITTVTEEEFYNALSEENFYNFEFGQIGITGVYCFAKFEYVSNTSGKYYFMFTSGRDGFIEVSPENTYTYEKENGIWKKSISTHKEFTPENIAYFISECLDFGYSALVYDITTKSYLAKNVGDGEAFDYEVKFQNKKLSRISSLNSDSGEIDFEMTFSNYCTTKVDDLPKDFVEVTYEVTAEEFSDAMNGENFYNCTIIDTIGARTSSYNLTKDSVTGNYVGAVKCIIDNQSTYYEYLADGSTFKYEHIDDVWVKSDGGEEAANPLDFLTFFENFKDQYFSCTYNSKAGEYDLELSIFHFHIKFKNKKLAQLRYYVSDYTISYGTTINLPLIID